MNTHNDGNGNRNATKTIFGKLAFLKDEVVWELALVGVILAAVVDGALSIGGGSIA